MVVNKKLLSELFTSMLSEVMAGSMAMAVGLHCHPVPGAISSKHHDFKLEGTTHTATRDLVTTLPQSRYIDLSHPRYMQCFPISKCPIVLTSFRCL